MPARYRFKWYDPARYVRTLKRRALRAVADEIVDHARDLVGIQGPPPSAPGDPPHRETGELQEGIYASVDERSGLAMVGSDVPYAAIVDATRPWLERAAMESAGKVKGLEVDD